jgi:hypothetical protein
MTPVDYFVGSLRVFDARGEATRTAGAADH